MPRRTITQFYCTYIAFLPTLIKLNCFFKWAIPGLFSFIFSLFQRNINSILQQIIVKKSPSSIWHWYSNPRPSKRESPPITTKPGLPPIHWTIKLNFYRPIEKQYCPYSFMWVPICTDIWTVDHFGPYSRVSFIGKNHITI